MPRSREATLTTRLQSARPQIAVSRAGCISLTKLRVAPAGIERARGWLDARPGVEAAPGLGHEVGGGDHSDPENPVVLDVDQKLEPDGAEAGDFASGCDLGLLGAAGGDD